MKCPNCSHDFKPENKKFKIVNKRLRVVISCSNCQHQYAVESTGVLAALVVIVFFETTLFPFSITNLVYWLLNLVGCIALVYIVLYAFSDLLINNKIASLKEF